MAAEKGRRFEFGWLEVLGLILVFAGGSAVVFFLGVFVGKGLQESRLAREERVVRLPVEGLPPAVAPGAPVEAGGAEPAAPGSAEVRLAVRGPDLRPSAEAGAALPTPAPGTLILPTVVLEPPRPSPSAAPSAAQVASGRWSVQVNATRDAATAKRLVDYLRARGFDAYEVRVDVRGEAWYRVRVGRYSTMQEATAMVVRLRNEEQSSRAFLVED